MKFGQELIVKKELKYNDIVSFEKGDILKVVEYQAGSGMLLKHEGLYGFMDFFWGHGERDKKINEFFEIVNNVCIWTAEEEDLVDFGENSYYTSCGNDFLLLEGTPSDNNMKYCCYCGDKIEESRENNRN